MLRFNVSSLLAAGKKARTHRRVRTSVGLCVEALEDRCVPAVLTVGPGKQFATIQAAVDAAHNGDQVRIAPGTYQEQVTIDKSILLQGTGKSTVILAPSNLASPTAANPDAIVRVTGSGIYARIVQLNIEGAAGGTANLLYGLRVDGNAFVTMRNTTITNIIDSTDPTLGIGVSIGNSATSPDGAGAQVGYSLIAGDTITNYQRAGIVVTNTDSSAAINGNTITAVASNPADSVTGVEVSGGAVARIASNRISGNTNGSDGSGIQLYSPGVLYVPRYNWGAFISNPGFITVVTTIVNNRITGNDYGIFGSMVTSSQGPSTLVNQNQILANTYVGIEFDNSSNVSIVGNHISNNGQDNTADGGIYLYQSTNNTLNSNVCKNNDGSGIYVNAGSTGNVLRANVMQNNVFDATAGNADAVDLSTGTGTSGTANRWLNDTGKTFITNSNESLFNKHK